MWCDKGFASQIYTIKPWGSPCFQVRRVPNVYELLSLLSSERRPSYPSQLTGLYLLYHVYCSAPRSPSLQAAALAHSLPPVRNGTHAHALRPPAPPATRPASRRRNTKGIRDTFSGHLAPRGRESRPCRDRVRAGRVPYSAGTGSTFYFLFRRDAELLLQTPGKALSGMGLFAQYSRKTPGLRSTAI